MTLSAPEDAGFRFASVVGLVREDVFDEDVAGFELGGSIFGEDKISVGEVCLGLVLVCE